MEPTSIFRELQADFVSRVEHKIHTLGEDAVSERAHELLIAASRGVEYIDKADRLRGLHEEIFALRDDLDATRGNRSPNKEKELDKHITEVEEELRHLLAASHSASLSKSAHLLSKRQLALYTFS